MSGLDRSHDPARRSFVASANTAETDFPIQNLPFGVFETDDAPLRVGVAIGDRILDMAAIEAAGLIVPQPGERVFTQRALNRFMELGPETWLATRLALSDLLDGDNPQLRDDMDLCDRAFVPISDARLLMPFEVCSFTDFYASREHATNVGAMFRGPENALMPNWLHLPVGYNGRASTVVVSGTAVRRPLGQMKPADADAPIFGPCQRLDFELELGAVVGTGNRMGEPVTVAEAYDMIFGYVLLNDWSARDIQAWEYVPLGPFQGKAFATSISPWVVTRHALEPYRVSTPPREKPLLPYLREPAPMNFDIALEVTLAPEGKPAATISRTNARLLYYSAAQQLAHHAIGGCRMCTGDLTGSGTISGPARDSLGSLLEMSSSGKTPVTLTTGETRSFLADGDTLTLRGWAQGNGHRVGFGACKGTILPAPAERQW